MSSGRYASYNSCARLALGGRLPSRQGPSRAVAWPFQAMCCDVRLYLHEHESKVFEEMLWRSEESSGIRVAVSCPRNFWSTLRSEIAIRKNLIFRIFRTGIYSFIKIVEQSACDIVVFVLVSLRRPSDPQYQTTSRPDSSVFGVRQVIVSAEIRFLICADLLAINQKEDWV
ncbi:hypothetical protein BRADI_4g10412v3 [Brachypodium distachyon]|uniref:Uncharacterized protein n=1 Tax=Brachypodium distachyon TaxID=15368 RepID=A0A2K2CLV1_BRADI|nr:hypothetical protein BRADI_4g10412v3 [Brachypodium distachyon]